MTDNILGILYPIIQVCNDNVEAVLPEWINELIFDRFGAVHNPARDRRTFNTNLGSGWDDVLTYLGTYFPRSLAESFVVFDSLLADGGMASTLAREEKLSICSVGTGTGGDLLGLILAIDKRIPSITNIDIVAIEGNSNAITTLRNLFSAVQARIKANVNLMVVNHVFVPPRPFDHICASMPPYPYYFDFITCSKMLNELDSERIAQKPYLEFCSVFSKRIKPAGVLLVLDVTSRNGADGGWTPMALNGQVNEFLERNTGYKTVLPLLCNRFEGDCGNSCYTQTAFYVTHRHATKECTKVCYRLIGSVELANRLSGSPTLWNCAITENNKGYCSSFR